MNYSSQYKKHAFAAQPVVGWGGGGEAAYERVGDAHAIIFSREGLV